MFNAHINIKVYADIRNVKYKYIYKGPDHVATVIASPTNEIQQYIDTQYLSATKGVDSLLLFKKHTEWLPIIWLIVHLLGQ